MAMEFNLLYRWHPLTPDTFKFGGRNLTVPQMLVANDVLMQQGLRKFMLAASEQVAGRIRLFNTNAYLVDQADVPSIEQGRLAELRSYNDYREFCHLPRLTNFTEFSSDEEVGRRLCALYDNVNDVEFYVGLFAEEAGRYEMLPPLMTAMVAFDAFSQVLTNPLLAPRVYGPLTFTDIGMDMIEKASLDQLIRDNLPFSHEDDYFSLRLREYQGP
jgi:prostaglandin-endoperoxide synthase 2